MESKTELNNRSLWYDGTNQVSPDLVPRLLLMEVPIDKILVEHPNEDVNTFNLINDEQISNQKSECLPFDMSWNIPDAFKNLNLAETLELKLSEYLQKHPDLDAGRYSRRLKMELDEIEDREIAILIKTFVYIIDKFKRTGVIWGVGRGSSCASLALFLIGLHRVDPVKFGIPMEEFFHD